MQKVGDEGMDPFNAVSFQFFVCHFEEDFNVHIAQGVSCSFRRLSPPSVSAWHDERWERFTVDMRPDCRD